jgi:hypothetical protein
MTIRNTGLAGRAALAAFTPFTHRIVEVMNKTAVFFTVLTICVLARFIVHLMLDTDGESMDFTRAILGSVFFAGVMTVAATLRTGR